MLKEFSHLMANPANNRQKTDNVRKHLAKCFPGVKFSVKYDGRGSWYNSVRIEYTDGPTAAAVEKAAKLFAYDSSECDPMMDYYEYNPTDFTRTFGGFTFVFVDRNLSDEMRAALRAEVETDLPGFPENKSITKDEFLYIFLKNAPAAVVEKYIKALSGAYWVSSSSLVRLLSLDRDYTSMGQPFEKEEARPTKRLEIVNYSEKAIAVFGDTKSIKDELKALGGRFNSSLTRAGKLCAGWVFPRSKSTEVWDVLSVYAAQTL